KLFPYAKARYQFINRGKHEFPPNFADRLREAIDAMTTLKLTSNEKEFLRDKCPYLDPTYLDFLQVYRYDPSEVKIEQNETDLKVSIDGIWYRIILWELPVISLICELIYQETKQNRHSDELVIKTVEDIIEKYRDLNIVLAGLGTRRRHS